jgi:hypothetical protein
MSKDNASQEQAVREIRNSLIKAGIAAANRLRELRSQGKNFPIAMSASGGLAIIATKGTKDTPGHYRFGSPTSALVACATQSLIDEWNRREPNHPIKMCLIQNALAEECSRVFLLLHELEEGVRRGGVQP